MKYLNTLAIIKNQKLFEKYVSLIKKYTTLNIIEELNENLLKKSNIIFFDDLEKIEYLKSKISKINKNITLVAIISEKSEIKKLTKQNLYSYLIQPIENYELENLLYKINKDINTNNLYNKKLEESKEIIEQILTTLTFDLKEILKTIVNASEMFRFLENNPERQLRFLNIIESSTENSTILLENIINWTKTKLMDNTNNSSIDLTKILENSLDSLNNNIISKQIEIKKDIPKILIYINKEIIDSLISNILLNIVNYTIAYGTINIKLYKRDNNINLDFFSQDLLITDSMIEYINSTDKDDIYTDQTIDTGFSFIKQIINKINGEIYIEKNDNNEFLFKITFKENK